MKKVHWMLFHTEHSFQYYFWNGQNAILVKNAGTDELTYNTRVTFSEKELKTVEEVAVNKRKKTFTVAILTQRMIVVDRGVFEEPENG